MYNKFNQIFKMKESKEKDIIAQCYAEMLVGEGILTGAEAEAKASKRRPKQDVQSYIEDGDIVIFDDDERSLMTVSDFGPAVPVAVTAKDGSKRGLRFFLSSFAKSFVLTDKDGNYVDENDNPSTTPVRAKTTGEPAEIYKGSLNVTESYHRFKNKKVRFRVHTHYGERTLWEDGKRTGKEIAEQSYFTTEWV